MPKPYQVKVFGKAGCQKCHVLNQRVDRILEQPEWQAFEKWACDVETEDGIIAFSEAECINPSRIPAVLVARWNEPRGEYEPMPNPAPGAPRPAGGKSRLYQYLGLQTDYRDGGGGVVTPQMITELLAEARS
jgi:hypothetical protein